MNWGDFWSGVFCALSLAVIVACTFAVVAKGQDEPDWEDEHERWCDCLCPQCEPETDA